MTPAQIREDWSALLVRVVKRPLAALAAGRLRAEMPIESVAPRSTREPVTHLEALGRSLTGLAPWLELERVPAGEVQAQAEMRRIAAQAIAQAVDPKSPDHLNFNQGRQPVVDAAFLAQAMLRAPRRLWHDLDATTQQRLIAELKSSRAIQPGFNNWLLFSATIEAALLRFTGECDLMRIDYAVRSIDSWYKGDGTYGDGPELHWDYYNSFVIQPMLLGVLELAGEKNAAWKEFLPAARTRAIRYAALQERMVAPDGSYPVIGRSLAYRCGAFQHLAMMALRHELPGGVVPAQVRGVLDSVIRRTLTAPGTFDASGWLRVGICGHQPSIGEAYISTGSLYLCSAGFLPLGLPADDPFWTDAAVPSSNQKAWSGVDLKTDHALAADHA
jgi:hypothetical protein